MMRIVIVMAIKRRKTFLLKTPEQLRVVSSPTAFEILQAIQVIGPVTVRELGPKLGRKSNSLHYHLRKLINAGMVHKTGSGQSGAREEAIYDVVADRFVGEDLYKNEELRHLSAKAVGSFLRIAGRNFENATADPQHQIQNKEIRTISALKRTARLSDQKLKEVNDCIERINAIFTENIGSDEGQMYSFTAVLVPINEANS
jgi:DNA-binding Lrp family transcriptional regulator